MKTKILFTICLLLFGAMVMQAQELTKFKGNNHKYGFKDQNGKVIIEPQYDYAEDFSEGLGAVNIGGGLTYGNTGKWGFIDKTGKVVIPIEFENVGRKTKFSEGLVFLRSNNKYGAIDKTGKKIIPFKYDKINDFKDGIAVVKMGNYYGCVDRTGKEIISPTKYDFLYDFFGDVAFFMSNNKYGLINKNGKELIKPTYDAVYQFSEVGLAPVNIGGKWEFDEGYEYVEGGKWGFIDKTGKVVIPVEYDYVFPEFEYEGANMVKKYFKKGKTKVKKGNREFFIDKTGKEVQ